MALWKVVSVGPRVILRPSPVAGGQPGQVAFTRREPTRAVQLVGSECLEIDQYEPGVEVRQTRPALTISRLRLAVVRPDTYETGRWEVGSTSLRGIGRTNMWRSAVGGEQCPKCAVESGPERTALLIVFGLSVTGPGSSRLVVKVKFVHEF